MNEKKIFDEEIVKEHSEYIEQICEQAFKNLYLISNLTLSKNPYSGSSFLRNILRESPKTDSFLIFTKAIVLYYIKNLYYFLIWSSGFLYNKCFFKKAKLKSNGKVILIDTFVSLNHFDNKGDYHDNFFNILFDYLEKNEKEYFILPSFFNVNKNLLSLVKIIRLTKNSEKKFVNEFDMLRFGDLLSLIKFIILYPFSVFSLKRGLEEREHKFFNLLQLDLSETLAKTTFHSYVKYLLGKRIKKQLKEKSVKLISWYENQPIDKYLVKGISSENTKIYGCQFFIKYPICQSHYVSEVENAFNTVPNLILVNGPYFLPEKTQFNYQVGPAFRYKKVFDLEDISHLRGDGTILVMLSYMEDESLNMINLLKETQIMSHYKIDFKLHPVHRDKLDEYQKMLPFENWRVVCDLPDENNYSLMFTSGSGTALEYATRGVSVIILFSEDPIVANPMPEYGRGAIWEAASTSTSIEESFQALQKMRESSPEEILKLANSYKRDFFSPVTDEAIKKTFELENF